MPGTSNHLHPADVHALLPAGRPQRHSCDAIGAPQRFRNAATHRRIDVDRSAGRYHRKSRTEAEDVEGPSPLRGPDLRLAPSGVACEEKTAGRRTETFDLAPTGPRTVAPLKTEPARSRGRLLAESGDMALEVGPRTSEAHRTYVRGMSKDVALGTGASR
jgi:hypothetical protein